MSSPIPLNEPVVIVNVASTRLLDADTGTIGQDGTRVQLFGRDATGQPQRQWLIQSAGGGSFNIVNTDSGRFLDADTGTINNDGTRVQLFGTEGSEPNRQWRLADQGNGTFVIANAESGRVLDADTGTLNNDGTVVQLFGFDANGMPNRQWRVPRVQDFEGS
jgi:Ricin-type beta-trefoil lectin domain-like